MKIAVRGGHNFSVPGARGIIDETIEDRKVKDSIIKYLKIAGEDVLDVTPPDSYNTVSSDLVYGVNKAAAFGAELFISCHFNKAYDKYDGAIGTEVLVYSKNSDITIAERVLSNITNLGFKKRGVIERPGLYELRATSMKSMIIETCFVEATKDVELYRSIGFDAIGKAIAEAILNKSISSNSNQEQKPNPTPSNPNPVVKPNPTPEKPKPNLEKPKDKWVGLLQAELNKQYNAGLLVDSIAGPKTLASCKVINSGANGNITTLIQKRLIEFGISCGKYGADGSYGASTKAAVINFQKMNGLYPDGIVGKNTWSKLLKL